MHLICTYTAYAQVVAVPPDTPIMRLTYLPTFLLTYLLTYLPTYLLTYLPT